MMIPVKIECGCGQQYEFEVEPIDGRMPSTVACPTCGADGTAAADSVIARSLAPSPTVAAASRGGLRLRAATQAPAAPSIVPGAAPRGAMPFPGQVDRTQAEIQARAKISWGDAPEEVAKYLRMQGFDPEEADSLVHEMFLERAAAIRRKGIGKIVIGIVLMFVPVGAWIIFNGIGIIYVKLFAAAVVVGVWGAWTFLSGLFMLVAPKSEQGDVADD